MSSPISLIGHITAHECDLTIRREDIRSAPDKCKGKDNCDERTNRDKRGCWVCCMQCYNQGRTRSEIRKKESSREKHEEAKQWFNSHRSSLQVRGGHAEADDLRGLEDPDAQRVVEDAEHMRAPVLVGATVDPDHLEGARGEELYTSPLEKIEAGDAVRDSADESDGNRGI